MEMKMMILIMEIIKINIPLLGQIDLNEKKGMSIIDNNLYRSLVFYGKINFQNTSSNTLIPNKKRYNFLLTFHKNKEGRKKSILYKRIRTFIYCCSRRTKDYIMK